MATASRASSPFWYTFANNGRFAVNGTMTTYSATNPTLLKPTYADPACINANPTTIGLDALGQPEGWPEIYWDDAEKYRVVIRCNDGTEYVVDNFPFADGGGGGGSVVGIDYDNKMLNGQFRIWFESPVTPTADEIEIAQFWKFKKSNVSATDRIEFNRFNLGQDDPEATPVYYFRYLCTGAGTGESYKDLYQSMADVRTFEQTPLTFSFDAYSDVPRTVEIIFVQNFGTGGTPSPEVVQNVGSINLPSGVWQKQSVTFTPDSVAGKSLGSAGDDHITFIVRFPLDSVCDIQLTNMDVKLGDRLLPYQRLTKEQEDAYLLGAMIPDIKDGDNGKAIMVNNRRSYDLMFPILPGMSMAYYGSAVPSGYEDEFALEQGQTVSRSQDKKRYARLFDAIGFAGGSPFNGWLTATNGDLITLCTTTTSPITIAANGTPSPGFTINQIHASSASNNHFLANRVMNQEAAYIVTKEVGITTFINNDGGGAASVATITSGNSHRAQISMLIPKPGSQITPGQFFVVHTQDAPIYFWYKVDGNGTAPTTTATKVQIDIHAVDTRAQVLLKTLWGLSGYQVDAIKTVAASAITAGSYITVNTTDSEYYFWFKIGVTGNDPAPSGRIGVMVALEAGDTASQVAQKLATAINSEFFRIPDSRGTFKRGLDASLTIDSDIRLGGSLPGSLQYDEILSHTHPFNYTTAASFGSGSGTETGRWTNTATTSGVTGHNQDANHGGNLPIGSGGTETRPINIAVNYLIKL